MADSTDYIARESRFQEHNIPLGSPAEVTNLIRSHSYQNSKDTIEWVSNGKSPMSATSTTFQISPRKNSKRSLLRGFCSDIGGLLSAFSILVAIIITLGIFNGKPEQDWKLKLNLNSLVALLTTILRASMLTVVSEALSQLKWTWFSKLRPINDLDVFDQATRGVWGSLKAACSIRKFHPIILGSGITILSLGIGPFTQQAIKSVSCHLPMAHMTASVPVIHSVLRSDTIVFGASEFALDSGTKGALINGISNPGKDTSKVSVNCPTGNCTFNTFGGITHSTLGLCTRCKDTSMQILEGGSTDESPGTNFTLPLPYNLTITDYYRRHQGIDIGYRTGPGIFTSQPEDPHDWEEPYNSSALGFIDILSFSTAGCTQDGTANSTQPKWNCQNRRRPEFTSSGASGEKLDLIAAQCVYYPCLRNYQAEVNAGILSETLVSTIPATRDSPVWDSFEGNFTAIKEPCYLDGQPHDRSNFSIIPRQSQHFISYNKSGETQETPQDCLYQMHHTYAVAIDKFFLKSFKGTGFATSLYASQFGAKSKVENILFNNNWWLSSLWNEGNISLGSISSTLDSMSTSFTNHVRTAGAKSANDSSSIPGQVAAPSFVLGTVYETTVCTRFDWKWLLFPIVLIVATLVLLLFTVAASYFDPQQLPIWKSSLLPLLFYGLEKNGQMSKVVENASNGQDSYGESEGLLGKEQLSAISSEKIVRFRRSEKGGGFEECES